jgi:hypothetical protein
MKYDKKKKFRIIISRISYPIIEYEDSTTTQMPRKSEYKDFTTTQNPRKSEYDNYATKQFLSDTIPEE